MADRRAGSEIPQPDRIVGTTAGKQLPRPPERHASHPVLVAAERFAHGGARLRIPQAHRPIGATACQQAPVLVEGDGEDPPLVSPERRAQLLSCVGFPQTNAVSAGARQQPFGTEREPKHGTVVTFERRPFGLAGGGVPQPDRAIVACGCEQFAITAEGQKPHAAVVAGEVEDQVAVPWIPQADRPLVVGAGEHRSVGAERDAPRATIMTREFEHLLAGPRVPQSHRAIEARAGNEWFDRAEGDPVDGSLMAAQGVGGQIARGGVPPPNGRVVAGAHQHRAIGTEGHLSHRVRMPA